MLAVVRTPRTDVEIRGEIPAPVLKALRHEYGSKLTITPDPEDEEIVSVFDTPEYKAFKKRVTPGDYVRAYRENLGLTQIALAEDLGVSRAFVCDIEHNRRAVSKKMAKELSALFKVSVSRFI
jgi:DNA-binding XRE family transcriptional regulator